MNVDYKSIWLCFGGVMGLFFGLEQQCMVGEGNEEIIAKEVCDLLPK